jgi:DNA-binding transcriptional LysR family regulator
MTAQGPSQSRGSDLRTASGDRVASAVKRGGRCRPRGQKRATANAAWLSCAGIAHNLLHAAAALASGRGRTGPSRCHRLHTQLDPVAAGAGVALIPSLGLWVPRTMSRPLISAFAASQPRSHGSQAAQQDLPPWPFDSRT